uniref:iron-containing alcohol dehydrogenase n=1 Tax=Paraburkholderia TaxID=1822464 RepID=UPI0038B9258A
MIACVYVQRVEAFARSTTKLVMQRHSHVPQHTVAWRSNAVRFAKRRVMCTARASAIWEHRSDQAWVSRSRSNRLPIIAIPTRYAGSEMTPIYGLTEDDLKGMGRDLRELPKTVIYDPDPA